MGDEVKITVIATGFKQGESQPRRERMLAESTLPTVRYDVPIQPRVFTARTVQAVEAPVVAPAVQVVPLPVAAVQVAPVQMAQPQAEAVISHVSHETEVDEHLMHEEPEVEVAEVFEAQHEEPAARVPVAEMRNEPSRPELIPVPRSVFDDDFFRSAGRDARDSRDHVAEAQDHRMPSARGFDSPDSPRPLRVQYQEVAHSYEAATEYPVAEPKVRVPAFTGVPAETAESDELDIPAFLRRNH
jgi:cell division protein FtsZ